MTEAIYGWMRNLAYTLLFFTAVLQLLPEGDYRRYVKYFLGLLLILTVMGPLLDLFSLEDSLGGIMDRYLERSEDYQQEAFSEGERIADSYVKEAAALTDIELCSLFANTLDNAIEACVKIKDREKRRITLKARSVNGHFSYEIVNAKENKVTERNGSFETDKEDKGSHGIGRTPSARRRCRAADSSCMAETSRQYAVMNVNLCKKLAFLCIRVYTG